MYIKSISLSGFRSFNNKPVNIDLSEDLTTFVGANGSGKTAVLVALQRLFGVTNDQRRIRLSDFHIPLGEKREDDSTRTLFIEATLAFPNLAKEGEVKSTPPCFKYMHVDKKGAEPLCYIRLEASWEADNTTEGTITQKTFWKDPKNPEKQSPIMASERSLIQVHYIPASRSANQLIKQQTALMKNRLFKAIEWSEHFTTLFERANSTLKKALDKEEGIAQTNSTLTCHWEKLAQSSLFSAPQIQMAFSELSSISDNLSIALSPREDGGFAQLDELSDGYTSLFYFALSTATFELEKKLTSSKECTKNPSFCVEKLATPILTLFAIEEPENHLAPFYLSRLLSSIKRVSTFDSAQSIVTSHSSSILSRIDPQNVRHFRLNKKRVSCINSLTFPKDEEDIAKYMKEAVMAYPELYFARCVVLCEGDSEQIVIPRIAQELGIELDPSFVAVVPLGGRHVEHFWRLLTGLQIPFATLIDLDLGRATGGWDRISYLYQKLLEYGVSEEDLNIGSKEDLSDLEEDFGYSVSSLELWVKDLECENVFMSWPIDLDMAMLNSFPKAYKAGYANDKRKGPRLTAESAIKSVLKKGRDKIWYTLDETEEELKLQALTKHFPHYNYLFLGKSKPASHLNALSRINFAKEKANIPAELQRLVSRVHELIMKGAE